MSTPETITAAIGHGLADALQAVPGQRKTPMENALSRQPEEEISYCTYLARLVLPRATGAAAAPAAEAWQVLRKVRAILSPELEKFRHDD